MEPQESLGKDIFLNGVAKLEEHYNKVLSKFAKDAWYKYLQHRMTDKRFMNAIAQAICTCEFLPTPQKLAEIGGAMNSPDENWQAYQKVTTNYTALPSTEIIVENMGEEQCRINLRRIIDEIAKAKSMNTKLRDTNPKEKFDSMRKMLLSGVPSLMREAVVWARANPDKVWLIHSDQDGEDDPVDMKWLEEKAQAGERCND